ncbi:hypothetical protein MIMGU_mgv1a016084mg [Erythranthe guttata]|uniref:HMG box domain-containing protein n=1 Tax=Erythranthe guttata TaxID=4155 RepID=A0A022RSQ2_ERYGU|nr:hypothetical protein MIMGU_mgv1a016084mg [Erythranthe guttata]
MKGAKSKADSRKADSRLAVKKQTKKERNAAKDPNKPKRAPSAFFVFMEDFRQQYKEKHPGNKSVAVVGKAGGDKWKSLTDELPTLPRQASERRSTSVKWKHTTKNWLEVMTSLISRNRKLRKEVRRKKTMIEVP